MKFEPTPLNDAWIITLDPIQDERGCFTRTFCRKELTAHGIDFKVTQCNASLSEVEGTLRGLHYQGSPHEEAKIVRCVQGSLYDVIVDFRANSPTYLNHFGIELSPEKMNMLYVPRGFAHGFITLKAKTMALYMMDEFFAPECSLGLRYNDPMLGIKWPAQVSVISEKDSNWPLIDVS